MGNKKIPKKLIPFLVVFLVSFGIWLSEELKENTDSKVAEEILNDTQQGLKNIEEGYSIASDIKTVAGYVALFTIIIGSIIGFYLYFRKDYTYI